jgi:hypothetical protein
MTDFNKQILEFEQYGTFTYKYDEVGNVVMNSSSVDFAQNYLAFPLDNFVYNNSKILGFYDPVFSEFIPTSQTEEQQVTIDVTALQDELDVEKAKNAALTDQLNSIIAESGNTSGPDPSATQQVVLELRKQLGQGRVDSDFSVDFPYSPVIKQTNLATGT